MVAEVLQPKNCEYRRRSSPKSNPNPDPNLNRSGARKRSSGRNTTGVDKPSAAKGLVMEQVKILKRGEALDDKTSTNINTMLKGEDDKSKSFGKVGDRRAVLKKDEKKVKFASLVKNVVVERKDDVKKVVVERKDDVKKVVVEMKDEKKVKFESDVKEVEVNSKDDLVLSSTNRLGPGLEMVRKVHDFHAGFGFVDSPSPSSLPLPAFFAKKSDPTTMALIRMLRLNL